MSLLGRHGSASLCRVERKNKMAATYNVLADISPGDKFYKKIKKISIEINRM